MFVTLEKVLFTLKEPLNTQLLYSCTNEMKLPELDNIKATVAYLRWPYARLCSTHPLF
jgi:hypothetical protein